MPPDRAPAPPEPAPTAPLPATGFGLRPRSLLLLAAGVTLTATGYAIFQVPWNIAAGGISGLSLIVNRFTGWPVGIIYFLLNIPLFVIGFNTLGRWQFISKTLAGVALFSVLVDLFTWLLPHALQPWPVTDNILLNALYGGIVGGGGGGRIYRSGASAGGTSILGRVVQVKTGIPLSQVLLMTDGIIVTLMGLTFGWEISLYALLLLFLWGMAELPFCPALKPSSTSPTSVRCRCRSSTDIRSMPVPRSARALKKSACLSRGTTWEETASGSRPR